MTHPWIALASFFVICLALWQAWNFRIFGKPELFAGRTVRLSQPFPSAVARFAFVCAALVVAYWCATKQGWL
jgi:hypothetical protein